MLENISEEEIGPGEMDKADEYRNVFFVFDSVLENSEMRSQTALQLFKDIQSETLQ